VGRRHRRGDRLGSRRIRHEATTDDAFARLLADNEPFFERVLAHLGNIEDELAAALA
jgi:hypothetical protein